MKSKTLGRTERTVSIIGMGTAFLGRARNQPTHLTAGDFEVDSELGIEALIAGLDAGISLIDTAPFYKTEPLVGEALKRGNIDRNSVTIMTKAGRPGIGEFDFSAGAIKEGVYRSLERLQVEKLDVVSIHDAVHEDPADIMSSTGAFGGLAELRSEGLIGAIGTACYDPALNAQYIETGEFDVAICSASWSMLNLTLRERILPAAEKNNVGLVIAEPLERGLLAVGVEPGKSYADRNFSPAVLEQVSLIDALCKAHGYRILDVGLQWLVREAQVSASIPGAATPDEAVANAAVGDVVISDEFWAELDPLVKHWSRADLGINIV